MIRCVNLQKPATARQQPGRCRAPPSPATWGAGALALELCVPAEAGIQAGCCPGTLVCDAVAALQPRPNPLHLHLVCFLAEMQGERRMQ